jgi:hypothetical protein
MDDLRDQMAAAAAASGIIDVPAEAETDPSAAAPLAPAAPEADDAPETEDEPDALEAALFGDDTPEVEADETEADETDYKTLYEEERAAQAERERQYAVWQAEQQRLAADQQRAQWAQAEQNLESWFVDSLRSVNASRLADERIIQASDDPNATRHQLQQIRGQQEGWVRDQYRQQRGVYDQYRFAGMQSALEAAYVQGFAEQELKRYRLPVNTETRRALMAYPDGTAVDPNAYPARAAELAEFRKTLANARRAKTQAERSAKAAEQRGVSASPGAGQAVPAGFDSLEWRDQLAYAAGVSGMRPGSQ